MVQKASQKKLNLLSVVSFVTLLLILVSVFVLSGSFSTLITTITKSKASQANPKVTESFVDPFKDGVINEAKWTVSKSTGVGIVETTKDNLRFDIPAGSENSHSLGGTLTFKELFKEDGDFRVYAIVYRPIVTGEGMGATGIRFSSQGSDDDEAAIIRWQVKGKESKVAFIVNGQNGKRLATEATDIPGNIAVLRLDRINNKYRAFYKVGNDLSGDTSWKSLGNEQHASLGADGKVSVYTNNAGVNKKFPKIVGRIDHVNIAWEGKPLEVTRNTFSDAFANGVIEKNWRVTKNDGVQVYENSSDNLIISLASGTANGKARYARVTCVTPTMPEHKDFTISTVMFKPTVVGTGGGYAGIGFASTGNVNDEAASVRWVIGASTNKIVFSVRAPDGSLAENASIDVPSKATKLVLRLSRTGDKYAASYKGIDSDADYVSVGSTASSNFGADGRVLILVNNTGTGGKYPRVVARFDSVSGSVVK